MPAAHVNALSDLTTLTLVTAFPLEVGDQRVGFGGGERIDPDDDVVARLDARPAAGVRAHELGLPQGSDVKAQVVASCSIFWHEHAAASAWEGLRPMPDNRAHWQPKGLVPPEAR